MSRNLIQKGPNFVHPEKPSAVGSRNSLNRNNRDEYSEAKLVIDEEVDKILNHIHAKLPPEVLEKLDIMGSIKSKLHNYFNQEFQNMLNRYIVTMEDELGKKVRDLVDKEEFRILNRYTPREISEILDRIGGSDKFNTGEVEKSIVNMYGHLHGHIQRGVNELEAQTNSILREKEDIGAFVRGENAYAIVKCSFNDNKDRPRTVCDVKLAINVLDSELISPIYHYQTPVVDILRDIIANHVHDLIDEEITNLNESLMDAGKEELNDTETIFERFKILDNYVDDEDPTVENSKRYDFVAKKFVDAIEGITAEIDPESYDALHLRENVKMVLDKENIRNRGFNTAVNSLTAILDTSKMGYQHLENFKNVRECVIREYADENLSRLPDERFAVRIIYLDSDQIALLQEAYTLQLNELEKEILKLWDLIDVVYVEARDGQKKYEDWDVLKKRYLKKESGDAPKSGGFFSPAKPVAEEDDDDESDGGDKLWNEVGYIIPNDTKLTQDNPTYEERLSHMHLRLHILSEKLEKTYKFNYPEPRRLMEERVTFLGDSLEEFNRQINPYHILPGLLLELDIVSIKRKKTTVMGMANVLNEFLFTISKGFADAAFASFSRRRSTVREDIDQEFAAAVPTD